MKFTKIDTQSGTVAAAGTMTSVDLKNAKGYGVYINTTVATPTTMTFVDADVSVANNTITETSHGYYTGVKGALTTAGQIAYTITTVVKED